MAAPSISALFVFQHDVINRLAENLNRVSLVSDLIEPIALRPAKAAKALGVHRSTLYRLEGQGKIKMERPTEGITLITMEEIRRFLKQRSSEGQME